jgi:hypothetical protein
MMSEPKRATVKISRAQTLAAQLIERIDRRTGTVTDPSVLRVAEAGRSAGVTLPAEKAPTDRVPADKVAGNGHLSVRAISRNR